MSTESQGYDAETGIYSYKRDGQWYFTVCPPDQVITKKVDGIWHFIDTCGKGGTTPDPKPEPEPEPEPEPVPETSLGTVVVSGPTESNVEKVDRYMVAADGDANPKAFEWSTVGGQISGSGLSIQVYWLEEGAGSVTCKVTSTDAGVTDSPTIQTVNVTVSPVSVDPQTVVGDVVITGPDQGYIGDEEIYTCEFSGDIVSPIYRWTIIKPSGQKYAFGGLTDNKIGVRMVSPGGFVVACAVDAEDSSVKERNVQGSLNVQVMT